MATTGIHGSSMFRNGCLKSPVDPRTGLQACSSDRVKYENEKNNEDPCQDLDSDQENKEPETGSGIWNNNTKSADFLNSSTSTTTAKLIENLTLGDMSDDEFYNKLILLKNEHKKTLARCEKMYAEKLKIEGLESTTSKTKLCVGSVDPGPAPTLQSMGRDYGLGNEQPVNTSSDTFNRSLEITGLRKSTEKPPRAPRVVKDQVRDMGSKRQVAHNDQLESPQTSESTGRYALKTAWTEKPHSNDYWKRVSDSSGDEAPDYDRNRYMNTEHVRNGYEYDRDVDRHPQELASAMVRIDDMWDNFSIEEYAPRSTARSTSRSSRKQRPSSGRASRSLDRRERPKSATRDRSSSLEDSWRHRITIPKPFSMTVRDETKPKMVSRTIAKYHEEKMMGMQEEDAECQKTFKATPVPAHVYLPLFDEINERAETRRRINKQLSKDILKSQEMPFKFLRREDKKNHNCHERTTSAPQRRKKTFKAKPVPKDVYDNTVSERIREEEEYRKIRIKMRAQELHRASSLPPNMAARGNDYFTGKVKSKIGEKAVKYAIEKEPKFRPKIKDQVPDFEKIHRKLQKEMMNQKDQKEATVCKPFNLRTSSIERDVDRVVDDMMRDELILKENRWPYQNPRARPRSGSIGKQSLYYIIKK
jgi:protein FAM161A